MNVNNNIKHKARNLASLLAKLMYASDFLAWKIENSNLYLQISPPSFAGKFPNFKLSKSWLPILYGHSGANLAPVAGGHPTLESHPSLNGLEVALAENGEVEFGNSSYRVKLSVNFDVPSPKLYRRDGLQLLRGDDVETGLSFDKDTTRHFFFFGKAAPSKLLLNLEVWKKIERESECTVN